MQKVLKGFWNRYLWENLTVRYVVALTTIAILAVSGQILIQLFLERQARDEAIVRIAERMQFQSERLRSRAVTLQVTVNGDRVREAIQGMHHTIKDLMESHRTVTSINKSMDFRDTSTRRKDVRWKRVGAQLKKMEKLFRDLAAVEVTQTELQADEQFQFVTLATNLLEVEKLFRAQLENMTLSYETTRTERTRQLRRTELILVVLLLTVLLLEGVLIFRPAVRRLYAALKARSVFLSQMSHEIRNPMNAIIGMTDMLSLTSLTPQQRRYVGTLKQTSRGLLDMLNHVLDFSALESRKMIVQRKQFVLEDMLRKTIEPVAVNAYEKGLDIFVHVGRDLPLSLIGDDLRLQQVLNNLLGNAIKFTKAGHITIQIELTKRSGRTVWIQCSVKDTGIGISPNDQKRIFEGFVQIDSSIHRTHFGSGLGLSISKKLIRLMNGEISVQSEENKGSDFSFTVPLRVAEYRTVGDRLFEQRLRNWSAIIVESNKRLAKQIHGLLTEYGAAAYIIEEAADLNELWKREEASKAQHVLMIVDTDIPPNQIEEVVTVVMKIHPETVPCALMLLRPNVVTEEIPNLPEQIRTEIVFRPVRPISFLYDVDRVTGKPFIPDKGRGVSETKSILVVDDSSENRELIRFYMQNDSFQFTFAQNGREAVAKVKEKEFNVILMDLQMPEMDGYSAFLEIRKWEAEQQGRSPVPIIAVSAHPDYAGKDEFDGFVTKPIDRTSLLSQVSKMIGTQDQEPTSTSHAVQRLQTTIADMLPTYVERRQREVATLRRVLPERDFRCIEQIGHKVKGNAKSFGLEPLGELGASLERAAQQKDVARIEQLAIDMETYLRKIQSDLSRNHFPVSTINSGQI